MKKSFKRYSDLSKWVIYLIVTVVIYTQLNIKYWQSKDRVICWDVISYYAYLPATFIYKDLSLNFTDDYKGNHEFIFWPLKAPNGKKVIKTSMGLSILFAPFFFIGHLIALNSNYDAGGYSAPYKFMLLIGSLFYLLVGLFYLRKILLQYFQKTITAVVLLLVFFATNLHYYSTTEATMSHVYNFALIAAFIWYTAVWFREQSFTNSLILGFLSGLISITRPTNSIIAIVFIFWDVSNLNELRTRLFIFSKQWYKLIIIILVAFSVWLPQLLYWKMQTGSYFYFSYGENEKFFFSNPQIINGLLSFRKGWLIYTPIMFFAVLGIAFLRKNMKGLLVPITIFLVVNVYIIFSWWCWWYGGCFGQRSFIDSYALMALPLGAFLSWFYNSKITFWRRAIIMFSVILILHGIYQTCQYHYGAIHWDAMTYKAYKKSIGKIYPPDNFDKVIKPPDYEKAQKGIKEY